MKSARRPALALLTALLLGIALVDASPGPAQAPAIWTPIGPDGSQVVGLARNPRRPNELYAAVSGYPGQVFRSANNGASWTRTGFVTDRINDVALDPLDSNTIYVLGCWGFFKSADGGATFSEVRFPAGFHAGDGRIAVNPANPKILMAAGTFYKSGAGASGTVMAVVKTADGGAKWTLQKFEAASADGRAYDVAISPKDPDLAFVCGCFQKSGGITTPRVFVSTNGGKTWKNATTAAAFQPDRGNICYGLAVDPNDANKAYVAHSLGLARTTDGGATWSAQESPSSSSSFKSVGVDSLNSNIVYAQIAGLAQSLGGGCYKSTDGGKNWAYLGNRFYGWSSRILARGPRVHVATSAGIFQSMNGGVTWKPSHSGIKASYVPAFAVAPSVPSTIYAAPSSYALFKTVDGGAKWTQARTFDSCDQVLSIAVHPTNAKTVYVLSGSGSPGTVSKSTDGGASFKKVLYHSCRSLALSPGDPNTVVGAGQVGPTAGPWTMGIHVSKNGGATWAGIKVRDDANSAADAAAVDPKNGNIMYVVGTSAAGAPVCYKSANGGASWTLLAVPTQQTPLQVVVDPGNSKVVYVASWDGVFRSEDGGASWAETGDFFDAETLVVNKSNPDEVFVGYPGGVYRSRDRGLTWASFIDDLTVYNTLWLQVDAKNRLLYAGTMFGGIWRRAL